MRAGCRGEGARRQLRHRTPAKPSPPAATACP